MSILSATFNRNILICLTIYSAISSTAIAQSASFGSSLKAEMATIQLQAENCRMQPTAECESKIDASLEQNLKWAVAASKNSPGLVDAIKAWDIAMRGFVHDGKPKAAISTARSRIDQELILAK